MSMVWRQLRSSSVCVPVRGAKDSSTFAIATRSGRNWMTQSAEAWMSSTGTSSSSRSGLTSAGSVHPRACPSLTMISGLGPQSGQHAASGGTTNVRSMSVPILTTSCRQIENESMSTERWRVAAV